MRLDEATTHCRETIEAFRAGRLRRGSGLELLSVDIDAAEVLVAATACPDWWERLGRAKARMTTDLTTARQCQDLSKPRSIGEAFHAGGIAAHERDLAILREEFGLEESGAEPAPVPAPLIAAVEWALAWASCTPCPSVADGMVRVGRALGASHPRVCIAEVELLAHASTSDLEAAVRAILAKADASPAQDAHSTPVTTP